MPWLRVNQTLLCWLSAVPAPVLALEVQRGGIPGQPGAYCEDKSVMRLSSFVTIAAVMSAAKAPCGNLRANHENQNLQENDSQENRPSPPAASEYKKLQYMRVRRSVRVAMRQIRNHGLGKA